MQQSLHRLGSRQIGPDLVHGRALAVGEGERQSVLHRGQQSVGATGASCGGTAGNRRPAHGRDHLQDERLLVAEAGACAPSTCSSIDGVDPSKASGWPTRAAFPNRCVDGIVAQVHRLEHEFHPHAPPAMRERWRSPGRSVDLRQERLDLLGIRGDYRPPGPSHTSGWANCSCPFEGTHLAAEQSDLTHPQSGQIPLDPAEEGEAGRCCCRSPRL